MSKPETRFYTAVHKELPAAVYRVKINNPYVGGIPDCWYSGTGGDLWVEYKWIASLPKRAVVVVPKLLSGLQKDWLTARHEEGRSTAVVLGSPEGAWVFEGLSWEQPIHPDEIRAHGLTKQQVADYIQTRTI